MVNGNNNLENLEARLEKAREEDAAEAAEAAEVAEVPDKDDSDKKDAAKAPDKNAPEEKSALRKIFGDTVENSLAKLKDLVAKARQSIAKKGDTERDKLSKDETNDLLEAHKEVTENMDKTKDTGVVTPGPNLNEETYVDLQNPRKLSEQEVVQRVASTKDALIVTNIVNPAAKEVAKKVKENKKVASSDEKQDLVAKKLANAEGKENVLGEKPKKGGDFKNPVEREVATSNAQSTNEVAFKKKDQGAAISKGRELS